MTYGPIDPETGRVTVKLIYDHRVLDGAYVARRLADLENMLRGRILDELARASTESYLQQGRIYIAPWTEGTESKAG